MLSSPHHLFGNVKGTHIWFYDVIYNTLPETNSSHQKNGCLELEYYIDFFLGPNHLFSGASLLLVSVVWYPSPSFPPKVLGSGCYRIGASVEFDWSSVSAVRMLLNRRVVGWWVFSWDDWLFWKTPPKKWSQFIQGSHCELDMFVFFFM